MAKTLYSSLSSFDVEVQVKYVPTKTLDEYRLKVHIFPASFTIRYEHNKKNSPLFLQLK